MSETFNLWEITDNRNKPHSSPWQVTAIPCDIPTQFWKQIPEITFGPTIPGADLFPDWQQLWHNLSVRVMRSFSAGNVLLIQYFQMAQSFLLNTWSKNKHGRANIWDLFQKIWISHSRIQQTLASISRELGEKEELSQELNHMDGDETVQNKERNCTEGIRKSGDYVHKQLYREYRAMEWCNRLRDGETCRVTWTGVQTGTTSLENCLAISIRTKHTYTL